MPTLHFAATKAAVYLVPLRHSRRGKRLHRAINFDKEHKRRLYLTFVAVVSRKTANSAHNGSGGKGENGGTTLTAVAVVSVEMVE